MIEMGWIKVEENYRTYKSATQEKMIRITKARKHNYQLHYGDCFSRLKSIINCNELCRLRNDENPPDRNRGEQLKTQAVNRLVEVIQKD
jgi:uncharacterized protein with PIN domain